jgi:hypothetical protein
MERPTTQAARARARAAFLKLPPQWQRRVLHAAGRYAPWEPQFDTRAPEPPPGLVTGSPDFVGVGVQKAGTSWWFRLITAHPDAYHHDPYHKERHFFSHLFLDGLESDLVGQYARWFPRPASQRTGEWTPDYLHQHWTPSMLAQAAPAARVLVLLRDPVERYRSGLDHHRQRGERLDAALVSDAFARGLYGLQLQRLERCIPAERILVLIYEACRDDPERWLRATYSFLGLDESFVPPGLRSQVSETTTPHQLPQRRRGELVECYAEDLALLASSHPELDLGRWPSWARRAGRLA